MSNLTEALTNAKKEIESQGMRLRDLEAMLNEERRAREDAEERANKLERESLQERDEGKDTQHANGDVHGSSTNDDEVEEKSTGLENGSASPGAAETTARLQQRLELMVTEMNEMKLQMERYRERAETAESDRKSLAEMIENIRRENASATVREARRRSRSSSETAKKSISTGQDGPEDDNAEEGEITIIRDKDLDDDSSIELVHRTNATNGHAVEHASEKTLTKTSNAMATRQQDRFDTMYYGGPVGAMVTVVAIGVAVMAMLNQYPRGER